MRVLRAEWRRPVSIQAGNHQLHFLVGAYERVFRLAGTITNLAGAPEIGPAHLAEMPQYWPRQVASEVRLPDAG